MAVVVRGISTTLGSFGSGWLKRWTTSYVMVLVCIGGLEVGSLVFLIAWERQPSFGVIVIFAAIFGLCYGLNATVGLGKQFTHTVDYAKLTVVDGLNRTFACYLTLIHCSLQWHRSGRQCNWVLCICCGVLSGTGYPVLCVSVHVSRGKPLCAAGHYHLSSAAVYYS